MSERARQEVPYVAPIDNETGNRVFFFLAGMRGNNLGLLYERQPFRGWDAEAWGLP